MLGLFSNDNLDFQAFQCCPYLVEIGQFLLRQVNNMGKVIDEERKGQLRNPPMQSHLCLEHSHSAEDLWTKVSYNMYPQNLSGININTKAKLYYFHIFRK